MIEKISQFTTDTSEIFEHIIKEEQFEYNHVVIKPKFTFPPHPTDAYVTITVIEGVLSIKLEEQGIHDYKKGQVIQVEQGVMSTLSNQQDKSCELFVIKRRD